MSACSLSSSVELAAGGAERLVDGGQLAPKSLRTVRREQAQALGVAGGAERRERALEGLAANDRSVLVVQLPEPWVDADCERVRAQEPRAEAVDRRDPRPVEPAREVGPAARMQRRTDARAQLTGRLARVGDHEHRLDIEPFVAHCTDEPLDEHGRLPGAGARRHEHLTVCVDRGALFRVHGLSTRHIGQRSHHAGHEPPFGSWRMSPARIRCAYPSARSRAVSTSAQKASSSR